MWEEKEEQNKDLTVYDLRWPHLYRRALATVQLTLGGNCNIYFLSKF